MEPHATSFPRGTSSDEEGLSTSLQDRGGVATPPGAGGWPRARGEADCRLVVYCPAADDKAPDDGLPVCRLLTERIGRDSFAVKVEGPKVDAATRDIPEHAEAPVDGKHTRCHAVAVGAKARDALLREVDVVLDHAASGRADGTVLLVTGARPRRAKPVEETQRGCEWAAAELAEAAVGQVFDGCIGGEAVDVTASFVQACWADGHGEVLVDVLAGLPVDLKGAAGDASPSGRHPCISCLLEEPVCSAQDLSSLLTKACTRAQEGGGLSGLSGSYSSTVLLLHISRGGGPVSPRSPRRTLLAVGDLQADSDSAGLATGAPGEGPGFGSLLGACLAGAGKAVVIAGISAHASRLEATRRALRVAQHLCAEHGRPAAAWGCVSASSTAGRQPRRMQKSRSLLQMRERHSECLRKLHGKVLDSAIQEEESKNSLQREMSELSQKLSAREAAQRTAEDMRGEQVEQLAQLRGWIGEHLGALRASSEDGVRAVRDVLEEQSAALRQEERAARERAERLGCQLAVSRADLAQCRRELEATGTQGAARKQASLAAAEAWCAQEKTLRQEVQEQRAALEVQRARFAALGVARDEERSRAADRECDMQFELTALRQKLEEARAAAEADAQRARSELRQSEAAAQATLQRSVADASRNAGRAEELALACRRWEAERAELLQREEASHQEAAAGHQQLQEEVDDARAREAELLSMLRDIQNSIISTAPGDPALGVTPCATPCAVTPCATPCARSDRSRR